MADTETKPEPAPEQPAAPGPQLAEDETNKVTTATTEAFRPSEGKLAPSISEMASNAASATAAVKDNVFSMFGGGPKKEKKEEAEEVDEPSGSSKAKAADVS